ncbi:kinetochore protein Spc24 isoform X2 [Chamaea fasciata]|uniref:kinetochore protein Spc24 isoform X2 n=1 Tax=Chamaea fasciata TaxID=190680 RepID=UPI003369F3EC
MRRAASPARFKRRARAEPPEKRGKMELSSGCIEELLQRSLERRERLDTALLETLRRARDMDKELCDTEARLSQRLLQAQAEAQRLRDRSRELDTELDTAQQALSTAREKTPALRQTQQELQQQLEQLRKEEQEEEEQDVHPDVYVAQLYYEISRIDLDFSAEPGCIRGVHYGPEIAVPLELDTREHSHTFVSDYLWGMVPTTWGPRRAPRLPGDRPAETPSPPSDPGTPPQNPEPLQ